MNAIAEPEAKRASDGPGLLSLLLPTIFVLVATGLIFCHGCHSGDHDDELSVPLTPEGSR